MPAPPDSPSSLRAPGLPRPPAALRRARAAALAAAGRLSVSSWGTPARNARVRTHAEPILQTTLAAGLAWLVAGFALGFGRAYFAPVAAMIVLGVAPGRRIARSLQVVIGIALGVLLGEAIVVVAGPGVVQVMVAAFVALVVAVWLDAAPLFASQAAVSAVLIVTLEPLVPGSAPTRVAGALVGGLVGLVVLAVVSRDPARMATDAVAGALAETAGAIRGTAAALRRRDATRAREAQSRAASALPALAALPDAVERAREAARLGGRRGSLARLHRQAAALDGLELYGGDVVALARAAARAIELGTAVPDDVLDATTALGDGARGVRTYLRDGTGLPETRDALAAAARLASVATEDGTSMPVGALAGAIRSVASDLLRASGLRQERAVALVRGDTDDPPAT